MARTRIKICGLTRRSDVGQVVSAGVDAVGFVFYPSSPRYIETDHAALLCSDIPPFVTSVGLFVNEDPLTVRQILDKVPLGLLQFHGDEDEAYCRQFCRPYIKAIRVGPSVDLLESVKLFQSASALLFDTLSDSYGGSGKTFDWNLVPKNLPCRVILSGGLTSENVGDGIRLLQPWAVDVSSGVEFSKGLKDAARVDAFVAAVKEADV